MARDLWPGLPRVPSPRSPPASSSQTFLHLRPPVSSPPCAFHCACAVSSPLPSVSSEYLGEWPSCDPVRVMDGQIDRQTSVEGCGRALQQSLGVLVPDRAWSPLVLHQRP